MSTEMIDFLKTNDAKFYAVLLTGVAVIFGYKGLMVEYKGAQVRLGTNNTVQQYI